MAKMPASSVVGTLSAALLALAAAGSFLGIGESQEEPKRPDDGRKSAPVGRIVGHVTGADGNALPGVAVYLEALGEHAPFSPPKAHAVVKQKGARFDPPVLVISVGQVVEFPNDEDRPVQHNVYSKSPTQQFDLGLYKPGSSKSVTFEKSGEIQLHCSIHRQMDGAIFVSPTPFFALTHSDGNFAIEDVVPGNYEVKTWQPKKRFMDGTAHAAVQAGQSASVNFELTYP